MGNLSILKRRFFPSFYETEAPKLIEFFKYYTKGYNKSVALKKAQQYLRSYKSHDVFNPVNYSRPYSWAGFILVD